ncbi:MAG TPA: hypothetical protein VLL07_01260 [Pontiella sp.]|nr:hypothetical protein [Pontiella sp.]
MKAVRIASILLLFAAAAAAFVWFHSGPETPVAPEPIAIPAGRPVFDRMEASSTNEAPAETPMPVQPLEERGDAMLFEIDALQNTPFDEAIVQPFD